MTVASPIFITRFRKERTRNDHRFFEFIISLCHCNLSFWTFRLSDFIRSYCCFYLGSSLLMEKGHKMIQHIIIPENMKDNYMARCILEAYETATNKYIDKLNNNDDKETMPRAS